MTRIVLAAVMSLTAASLACGDEQAFEFPLIAGYGGVVVLPGAAEKPRAGAKIVFDITSESKPAEVNRGLESVARYLNLNAQAGHRPSDVKLVLVLHGGATKCALVDEAYRQATSEPRNPNLSLVRELKKHGVEVFVCGQSLARNKFSVSDVSPELTVAVSAMTVNVNKQLVGFAYLAIH
jgi:intracellular sulfur oxidation DsrE/DsrF family protein